MAVALTARRTGQIVQILVDDSCTKVGGICQIVNIKL